MNLLTRFFRLFDFEYQKSFRLAVYNLNVTVKNNNARVQSDFSDFVQNNSRAIYYIHLLKNEFTSSSDVYKFLIKGVETILAKHSLTTRFFDQMDNQIYWQEIFNSLNQIKLVKKREQVRAELRLLLTISDGFSFGKPWLI